MDNKKSGEERLKLPMLLAAMNPFNFPKGKSVESSNFAQKDLGNSLGIGPGPTQNPSLLLSGIHPEDQLIVTLSSNETVCMPSFNSVTSKEETLEGRNFNLRMQQQTRFSTSYKAGEQFLDYLTIDNPQDSLMYTSSCDINVLPANGEDDLEGLVSPTNGLIGSSSGSNEDSIGCISNELPNHSVGSSCAEVSSLLFPTSQKNSDGMGGSVDQIFYSMSASGLASRPKRSNVKISKDQKRVATRRRRQRIRQQIRILQRLVPGGTKMDTASLLDEAVHYVKFMKLQVQTLKYLCHIAEIPPVPSFVESKLPSFYSPDYNLDQLQMSSRATTALYDAMHLHAASSYQASTSKG